MESVNGHTHISDTLRHHTSDQYCVALKYFVQIFGCLPFMFKADVDAAFRRVPVCPSQRKYFASAFKHEGQVHLLALLFFCFVHERMRLANGRFLSSSILQ